MKKMILITRPSYDTQTHYLHFISGEIKKEIESVGEVSVIDLETDKATRKEFEKALDKANPRLVLFHGHGSYDSISGQNGEIVLDNRNIRKLKSRIIYAVVCDSASELGETSIKDGEAEAYIGYDSRFVIVIERDRSTTPMKDKNFKPFKDTHKKLILSLVSGINVEVSVEKTKKYIRELIREYGVRGIKDKYGDAPLIRFGLYWNLMSLKVHGNSNAVF